jgi:hypothetical protein
MAVLVPCLETLFDEFDELAPNRDTSTDGWIGDSAHADRSSDHNPDETGATPDEDSDNKDEVHAIDVDKDLNKSGTSMEDCVQTILKRCRKNNDDPDNEPRLKYIIYNRRIWEAPSWNERNYTGSNPHDKHAHFSAEYDSKYSEDTSPWGLLEDDMPSVDDIWNKKFTDPYDTADPPRQVKALDWLRYVPSDADVKHVGSKVDAVAQDVEELKAQLDRIEAILCGDQ